MNIAPFALERLKELTGQAELTFETPKARLRHGIYTKREDVINKIKPLAEKGFSSNQIAKELKICPQSVYFWLRQIGDFDTIELIKRNGIARNRSSDKNRGRPSSLKGKTYLDIFSSEEKAEARASKVSIAQKGRPKTYLKGKTYEEILGEERGKKRREEQRAWMRTSKNIRRYAAQSQPSKPQLALYSLLKSYYPLVQSEFPVEGYKNGRKATHWLDAAVVEQKLDFEYDDPHWHDALEDLRRDINLQSQGWKVTRIVGLDGLFEFSKLLYENHGGVLS